MSSGDLSAIVLFPNITYSNHFSIKIGELTFDLHHAKGETDDHTWVWITVSRSVTVLRPWKRRSTDWATGASSRPATRPT